MPRAGHQRADRGQGQENREMPTRPSSGGSRGGDAMGSQGVTSGSAGHSSVLRAAVISRGQFCSRGHLAMLEDTSGVTAEEGTLLASRGRGQGCRSAPYKAQDSLPPQRMFLSRGAKGPCPKDSACSPVVPWRLEECASLTRHFLGGL